jgi:hypothetical protein
MFLYVIGSGIRGLAILRRYPADELPPQFKLRDHRGYINTTRMYPVVPDNWRIPNE